MNRAPEEVYSALLTAPLGSSLIVRTLLKLRALPSRFLSGKPGAGQSSHITLADTIRSGFFLVDEEPGREMVLGAVGRFWKLRDGMKCNATIEDLDPPPPGSAAALWNFRVVRSGHGSTLHTETRVRCADEEARRSFRRYWLIVGPFSGLIRRAMLRAIKRAAEAEMMPLDKPRTLSAQQAYDVAAYVNSRPRPDYPARAADRPAGGAPKDVGYPVNKERGK